MDLPPEARPAQPLTRWSLIAQIQTEHPRVRENALNELLAIYYPVLRQFLMVGMGFPPQSAEDLLQSFVMDKVLKQDVLAQARQEKGRFRNFLLKILKNYALGEIRRRQSQKRATTATAVASLEELHDLASSDPSQEHRYHLEWARQTLAETFSRMRRECGRKGRTDLWEIFNARTVQPLLEGGEPLPYETLVARYGYQSPTQVFNALITAKRMFKRLLEEVVRDTVENDTEVEDEIRELKRVLSK